MSGLIDTYELLREDEFDGVLMATIIAFGFVFIHPFEDGNGRIHRYLFHHVLADKGFVPKGLIFPVFAVIFDSGLSRHTPSMVVIPSDGFTLSLSSLFAPVLR